MMLWCTSWALAATLEVVAVPGAGQFDSVQAAADAASPGDEIFVEAGTFEGAVSIDKDLTLHKTKVAITALSPGTAALEYVVSVDDTLLVVEDLTLDGAGVSGGLKLAGVSTAEVNRVKFRRGSADRGAGMQVYGSADATVRQSVWCDNVVSGYGGAIYIHSGGFVAAQESLFVGNVCTGNAGGAAHPDGDASFVNNTFVANQAVGGAALASSGAVEFVNNLVLHHVATGTYPSGDEAVQEHGSGYSGGSNLCYGNIGGDAEVPLPGDVFGLDPGLPSSFDCDTLQLGDAALLVGSVAIGSADAAGGFDDDGAVPFDVDDDGYGEPEDCDDDDPLRRPGAAEVCNGVDDNCDGVIDENALLTWYADGDGDGYGGADSVDACAAPDSSWVGVGGTATT